MENKRVLFIGVSNYNLEKPELQLYLKKKFEGLSKGADVLVLAKGKPFYKEIWGASFYLLPPMFFFWPLAFFVGFYLCLFKKIDIIVAQSPLAEGLVGSIFKRILRKELIVEDIEISPDTAVTMLGVAQSVSWRRSGRRVVLEVPALSVDEVPCKYAYTFKITGVK